MKVIQIMKSLTWTFFANLIVSLVKWLIVILIARILSPTEVGQYSLAFAVSAPFVLLANMRLRTLYITNNEFKYIDLEKVRTIMSTFSILLMICISYLFFSSNLLMIILIGILKLIELRSDMQYSILHKQSKFDTIAKFMVLKNLIGIFIFALTLYVFKSLYISVTIDIIFSLLWLNIIERPKIVKFPFSENKINTKNMDFLNILVISFPLGIIQALSSFNTNIPRYFLENKESIEALGVFSAIFYIAMLGNIMANAISQIFLTKLSNAFNTKNYELFNYQFRRMHISSFLLGIFMIVASIIFGEEFLKILYGETYADNHILLILVIVSVSMDLFNWNYDTALMSIKTIDIFRRIISIVIIMNLIISWTFVSGFGLYGAGIAVVFNSVTNLILKSYYFNVSYKKILRS